MEQSLITSRCEYYSLNDLLAAGKWHHADEETLRVMLAVAARERENCLDAKSIENFPCEDFRIIDQLWVKHSNGHFGFSVQKRIYESLGGTKEYNEMIWKAFGDRVGWRSGGKWRYYLDCWRNQVPLAPICRWLIDIEGWDILREFWCGEKECGVLFSSLVSKLADCEIV